MGTPQKYRWNCVTYHREYQSLSDAKQRCHNPKHRHYCLYGKRGIEVCPEWRSDCGFDHFMDHIGPKPDPKLTLDRINNDKGYEPGNVRWVSMSVQNNNRRQRKAETLTYNNETLTYIQWASKTGISCQTLKHRIKKQSMDIGLALTTPTNR
jgi:hypothetical protein